MRNKRPTAAGGERDSELSQQEAHVMTDPKRDDLAARLKALQAEYIRGTLSGTAWLAAVHRLTEGDESRCQATLAAIREFIEAYEQAHADYYREVAQIWVEDN
jgi:hypothetical protein